MNLCINLLNKHSLSAHSVWNSGSDAGHSAVDKLPAVCACRAKMFVKRGRLKAGLSRYKSQCDRKSCQMLWKGTEKIWEDVIEPLPEIIRSNLFYHLNKVQSVD